MTIKEKSVKTQAAEQMAEEVEIKTIGASGQLYFGKAYAGKTVMIEKREPGVWLVRTASVIPDNEKWLHTPEMQAKLEEAFEWIDNHPAQAITLEDIERLKAL
ncbi:hypothetical protein [Deinococcus sp.]|uniref:hypothetical protein n=1 Tax=Deinococcus sp. TaxID=47478 RepID=UPI003B5CB9F8